MRTPALEPIPGFCCVERQRGSGGSTADRESSAPVVDEHRRWIPREPLRRYVAWYTGYRQRGVPPARHRGLPSGDFGTLLGGLHSAPALIAHGGAQSGIQVALRPLGARALLGLPAGELADIDVPAEAVLGGVCAELRDRVAFAAGWRERFAILDEILLRLAASPGAASPGAASPAATGAVAPEVGWAW